MKKASWCDFFFYTISHHIKKKSIVYIFPPFYFFGFLFENSFHFSFILSFFLAFLACNFILCVYHSNDEGVIRIFIFFFIFLTCRRSPFITETCYIFTLLLVLLFIQFFIRIYLYKIIKGINKKKRTN